jgi:hypothetical protein
MQEYSTDAPDIRVIVPADASPLLQALADLLHRQVAARCGTVVRCADNHSCTIELSILPELDAEGYAIEDGPCETVRIAGGDARGVLYGIGKFLRTSRFAPGVFTPGDWRGASKPVKKLRGIYFATHYYNFYQTAPIDEVIRYIEELALWGMNTLAVWYDMHHFEHSDHPEAVAFRERLRQMLAAARRLGLDTMLLAVGNEAYANSPLELRADATAKRGGYYDVAVCPSTPSGMDYILQVLGDEFDWAREVEPSHIGIWPYDQGGCGCEQCRPWGSNGFMRCVESVSSLARRKLPGVKVILSTWYFNQAEWRDVARILQERPELVDGLLMEHFFPDEQQVPVHEGAALGLPVVGFPEISMWGMFPWGGFGANPQPKRFHREWIRVSDALAGGFPYSEGIFEDINKVLWTQLYWNPDATVDEILGEYIAYYFSPEAVADVRSVIYTLEQNHHFRWWPGKLDGVKLPWFPSQGLAPQPDPGAEDAFAAMQHIDRLLSESVRASWRWRILYIRAMMDSELKTNGGAPTPACLEGFSELNRLFHVVPDTDWVVRPPINPTQAVLSR